MSDSAAISLYPASVVAAVGTEIAPVVTDPALQSAPPSMMQGL